MVALPTDVARSGKAARSAFETVFKSMVSVLERSLTQNGHLAAPLRRASLSLCIGAWSSPAPRRSLSRDELRRSMSVALDLGGWTKRPNLKTEKPKRPPPPPLGRCHNLRTFLVGVA